MNRVNIYQQQPLQKTLPGSEEFLRTLLQNLGMGVVVHAADTSILQSNAIAQKLLGLTLNQMRGKTAVDPLYEEEQKTLSLCLWSKETLKGCKAVKAPHYPLDEAGIWADCIRLKKPVIHNDYQNLPHKKGYPEGHFPVTRHMSIPVFDGSKIVAIAGVGNKPEDYDKIDVSQLTLFTHGMLEIIERKRAEKDSHRRMTWAVNLQKAGEELADCKTIEEVAKIGVCALDKYLALQMVWISVPAEDGTMKTLVCNPPDLIESVKCPCVSKVYNTRYAILAPDIVDNPPYPDCRCKSQKGDFRSCATFPIMMENDCIATLSIHSKEKGSRGNSIQAAPLIKVFCRQLGYVWQRCLVEKKLRRAHKEAEIANQTKSEFLANMSHELGAIDYITKPINPTIVKTRVKNHRIGKILLVQKEMEPWFAFSQGGIYDPDLNFSSKEILKRELGLEETMFSLRYTKTLGKVRIKDREYAKRSRISTISIVRNLRGKGYIACFVRTNLNDIEQHITLGEDIRSYKIVSTAEARKLICEQSSSNKEINESLNKKQQLLLLTLQEMQNIFAKNPGEEKTEQATASSES